MQRITRFLTSVPTRHHAMRYAGMGLALCFGLALTATSLMAQLPDFTTVTGDVQNTVKPIITFVKFAIMVICVLMAIVQGWRAANGGQASGYVNAVILLIVAGFAASPSTWVNLLGLNAVSANLAAWGL